jgi:signal transduction histidine kinase
VPQKRLQLLVTATAAAALLIFLVVLARIFHDEEHDALTEISGRREALKQYAEAAVSKRLHDALAAVEPRIEAAVRDPLVDADGTLYITDGRRLLPVPPPLWPAPRNRGMFDGDEASEDPFFMAVLAAKDDAAVERAVRGLLRHRARWHVEPEHDCSVVSEIVDLILPRASPELLRGLLRDGFTGQDGLQRKILKERETLGLAAFGAWCYRIVELSRRAGIEADDFEARCAEKPVSDDALPDLSALPEGPSRLAGWYVERTGSVVRGLRVDLAAETEQVQVQMKQLGLIEPDDWGEAISRAHSLFQLKAGLLGLIAALGLGMLALAHLAQRRKLRFVEMKEDFVAAVSHELKTPLASMRVMAETLQHRLEGNVTAKDYPARLVAEVDGLHALVENILSFNRLDKGRWEPQRSTFPLSALIPALVEDAPDAKLTFEGFEDAKLNADAELMRLCLLNLLRNACRYNVRDPVEVRFSYGHGVLRVADNGIGIPAADHERVFEDFVRLNAVPRVGTGLGLALCRRVMAMHAGSIVIEQSGPEGTTFTLRGSFSLPGSA